MVAETMVDENDVRGAGTGVYVVDGERFYLARDDDRDHETFLVYAYNGEQPDEAEMAGKVVRAAGGWVSSRDPGKLFDMRHEAAAATIAAYRVQPAPPAPGVA